MSQTDDAVYLSESDVALAEHWARTNDSSGAARAAGYTGKYPSNYTYNKLFRKPGSSVYEYAMMLRREIANSRGIDPSSFLDFYIQVFTRKIDESANECQKNMAERTKMAAADKLAEYLQFFGVKSVKVDNKHSGELDLQARLGQGLDKKALEFFRYDVLGLPRPQEGESGFDSPEETQG